MKQFLSFLSLFLLTSLIALAQEQQPNLKALDERYGFREARFESAVSSYKDLVLAEEAGTTRFYRRTNDVKTLGEGELTSIRYGFYKGKLAMIILETKGLANSRAVLNAIKAQYGPGKQNNPFQKRYAWNGDTVTMSYDENAASNDATIFISSKKLRALQLKEQSKSGQKIGSVL